MNRAGSTPEPLRILVVQDTDWIRRGPHHPHHLFERLQLRGHAVEVVDFPLLWRGDGRGRAYRPAETLAAPAKTTRAPPLRVHRAGFPRLRPLDYAGHAWGVRRVIRRRIREFCPDVIVGHGILADRAASLEGSTAGVPYVAHWLDALDEIVEPSFLRPVARHVIRRVLPRARRLIAINHALARYAHGLGARPDRTVVIPAGLDVDRYADDGGREKTRQDLGVRPDQTLLFFMGWLYGFSGVDTVARQLLDRSSVDDRLVFAIAGDGDLLAALRGLASTAGASSPLRVLGRQPFERIPALLSASDVCLLPAQRNATMEHIVPIKTYEYLAAGRPVVSTWLPGLEEEFGSGSGIHFVPSTRDVLAHVIEHGYDPGSTVANASRIRSQVAGHSWDQITTRFEDALREVVRSPSRVS